jgi:hypothetical protein
VISRLRFFTRECEVIPRSSRSMTFRIVSVWFAHCVNIESAIETGIQERKETVLWEWDVRHGILDRLYGQ